MATGGRRQLSKAKVASTSCITTVAPPRRSLYSPTLSSHTNTLSHSIYTPTHSHTLYTHQHTHTLYTHKHTLTPTHSLYTPTHSLTNTLSILTNTLSHQHTLYTHQHTLTPTHSLCTLTHTAYLLSIIPPPIYIFPSYYMTASSLADILERQSRFGLTYL